MGLEDLHPILLAFLSSLFTWGTTALGASVVFCFGRKGFRRKCFLITAKASKRFCCWHFWLDLTEIYLQKF